MTTPDPISDAQAYQRSLLQALAGDDPAEVQARAADDIRALVTESGRDLRTRPARREWSALLCLAHIADAELVMAARYRFVLTHDRPDLLGYDQDLWVDGLHRDDEDPAALLRTFEPLRASNIELWRGASEADRQRVGLHRERGAESFELMFRMIAGHDRVHLAQARRAVAAARA